MEAALKNRIKQFVVDGETVDLERTELSDAADIKAIMTSRPS